MRPCERQCKDCKLFKHHSRFRLKTAGHTRMSRFAPLCKDCEQKARNARKNDDRAMAIMQARAARDARKAGVGRDFFWVQMNYRALVPLYRGEITPEGLCLSCGHEFDNERDVHIEHIEPPRHHRDWARLHARNLRFLCGSSNATKGNKPFAQWLDEQESARLSNLNEPRPLPAVLSQPGQQMDLW